MAAAKRRNDYFAEWFRRTLDNFGMSGGEVARSLNVSDGTVSRWNTGKSSPSVNACIQLGHLFNVNGLALAVTAGTITEDIAGVGKLPLPANKVARERVHEHFRKTPGLTDEDKRMLMEWYNRRFPDNEL
ncbi:helix-turn-helix domain-containing protein [Streptomyces sp. NPDC055085]